MVLITKNVALIGRPNVGKSTLFNRLIGRKRALVDDRPGVTRDVREGHTRIGFEDIKIFDTAGINGRDDSSMTEHMRQKTLEIIDSNAICLFLFDALSGICPSDLTIAEILRKRARKVILVANKTESPASAAGINDGFRLGLGEPIAISAEHGLGIGDLFNALKPFLEEHKANDDISDDISSIPFDKDVLRIAVLGRPNAGKSTLINQILGKNRLLTGPEAGITRDAIGIDARWYEHNIRIFDTAGIRKKAKITDKIEKLSVADGLRAVRFAEIVIIVLDAQIPFERQDLRLASLAEEEGRAVVVTVNKWDCVREKQQTKSILSENFEHLLPQLRGAPLVPISAEKGTGLKTLYRAVIQSHAIWNRRIPTARLNSWLEDMIKAHPPPAPSGQRIKIKFITQAKTRPPTFVIKTSRADRIPQAYQRYLVGGLRRDFDFAGVPLRLYCKSQSNENPFRNMKPHHIRKKTKK